MKSQTEEKKAENYCKNKKEYWEKMHKQVEKLLKFYTVKAPSESYCATFSSKQFLKILKQL